MGRLSGIKPTRREFVRDLGLGAALAGIGGFFAARLFPADASGPSALPLPNDHPEVDPIKELHGATLVAVTGASLTAAVDGWDTNTTLPAVGFGSWQHRVGDRVAVAKDYFDAWGVYPLVTTVTGSPPASVEVGQSLTLGDTEALIPNLRVKRRIEELAQRGVSDLKWMITTNTVSGEDRIIGVVA